MNRPSMGGQLLYNSPCGPNSVCVAVCCSYVQVAVWQCTHPDGLDVFHYPTRQVEGHFPDGRKEVIFADGAARIVTADG